MNRVHANQDIAVDGSFIDSNENRELWRTKMCRMQIGVQTAIKMIIGLM